MSRIVWDRPTDRKFEAGVEKGVLYTGNNNRGVPWNGLISVSENYSEGMVEARYQDGVKRHNYVPTQEFESEITAYTYPEEFEECLGIYEAYDGFFVSEQDRRPFGITYQTKAGNANPESQLDFKIHIIYNAIATPNDITRDTIGDEIEPVEFSWGVQTAPVEAPGFRPSSHFVLDPSRMGPRMFEHIYNRLYGAPGLLPRLLYPKDILEIAGDWHILYPSSNTYPSLDTLPGGP